MGRACQAAVCGAHVREARRGCDSQHAAGTLDLAVFEELDLERGEVCGRHWADATEVQSTAVRGVERLETMIDFTESIDLDENDELQDEVVDRHGTDDRIDRHGAKGVRYVGRHDGAAALQRGFDQPAKLQALRRGHGRSIVGDLRLEPRNIFLAGDIGEDGVEVPGDGDLQLRAGAQLGEDRIEQWAFPFKQVTYAFLVRHPRTELHGQDPRRSHELLDHLLMDDEQARQFRAAAAFQVGPGTAADDCGIWPGRDHAETGDDRVHADKGVPAARLGPDDGIEIDRLTCSAFGCPGAHGNCSWPHATNVSSRSRRSCSNRFCSAMVRACDDRAGSLSHQLMPIATALSTDAISRRSRMLRSSTPTRQMVTSPAITTPLSRMRSRMSASAEPCTECCIRPSDMTSFPDSSRPRLTGAERSSAPPRMRSFPARSGRQCPCRLAAASCG